MRGRANTPTLSQEEDDDYPGAKPNKASSLKISSFRISIHISLMVVLLSFRRCLSVKQRFQSVCNPFKNCRQSLHLI